MLPYILPCLCALLIVTHSYYSLNYALPGCKKFSFFEIRIMLQVNVSTPYDYSKNYFRQETTIICGNFGQCSLICELENVETGLYNQNHGSSQRHYNLIAPWQLDGRLDFWDNKGIECLIGSGFKIRLLIRDGKVGHKQAHKPHVQSVIRYITKNINTRGME